jgi:hypothetical protein
LETYWLAEDTGFFLLEINHGDYHYAAQVQLDAVLGDSLADYFICN